jgi:hypothetical protein
MAASSMLVVANALRLLRRAQGVVVLPATLPAHTG